MQEKISVVVPIYNVEQYLVRCIESILQQTYPYLEIILVDDGSSDHSGEICDQYKQKDARIQVIHKQNGGLSDARNAGIKLATGKYIGFVDSDDYIHPKMYEVLLATMQQKQVDIAICNYQKINEQGIQESKEIQETIELFDATQAINLLFSDNEISNYAWNKLYKKELFEGVQYPFGKKMEDIGTTYRLFMKANQLAYTNYIGYYYYQRSDSILKSVDTQFIKDFREMINVRYNDIMGSNLGLKEQADVNRLTFIKYYFMHIAKIKQKELAQAPEFLQEYQFFKKNYPNYRKKMNHKNLRERILNELFYYYLPLYMKIYEMKG